MNTDPMSIPGPALLRKLFVHISMPGASLLELPFQPRQEQGFRRRRRYAGNKREGRRAPLPTPAFPASLQQ